MKIKSLTVRLALSVGIIVTVLTACLVLYFVHDSFNAATHSGQLRLQQLAVQSVDHLDFLSESAANNIRSFADYDTVARSFSYAVYRDQAEKTLGGLLHDYKLYTYLFAFDPAGKIIFGVTRSGNSLRGIDVSDRSYFKDIKAGKAFAMSDVIKPKDAKAGQVVVMSVPVTDKDGKYVGGMCVGFDWSEYAARYLDTVHLGETGYLFMLNTKGEVISHALDKGLMFKDVSTFDFVQQILKGQTGSLEYDWKGEDKLLGYAKVDLTGWYVCMTATKSELLAETIAQRNMLVGFGVLLILALSASVTLVMRRLILRPVQGIQQFTNEIASGNFSARFVSRYGYELGLLQDDITSMVAVLRDKLALAQGILNGLGQPCLVVDQDMRILHCNTQFLDFSRCPESLEEARGKTASEIFYGDVGRPFLLDEVLTCRCHVSRQVELVNRNGKERLSQFDAAPMYDLDGQLFGAFALFGNLTELGRQQKLIAQKNEVISAAADQAGDVASSLASATDELTVQIEESHSGAEDQTRMISEMSSALELMQGSITDVAMKAGSAVELAEQARDQALTGKGSVEDVVQMIEEVNNLAQDMKVGMAELGDKADGIGRIIDVISDIADQTNLLALNAAIEAARAGDAGRGFAVVADEVRKLAEKTMTATRDVGEAISVIQGSVRNTIGLTENTAQRIASGAARANESGAVLETIVATVSESAENVRAIAAATGEQSAASEEVLATAEQVRTIATITVDAMRNSAQAVAELSSLAAQLKTIIASMQHQ